MDIPARVVRRARPLANGALALALAASGSAPTVAGQPDVCKVRNTRTAVTVGTLTKAVKQARDGDRLEVRGTCVGATNVTKDLVIMGFKTPSLGTPILSGGDEVRPLRIAEDATVTLVDLTVRDGLAPFAAYPGNSGAGILVRGHLTLRDTVVRNNYAVDPQGGAGGIEVLSGATLIVRGSSRIRNNVGGNGGGIETYGSTVLRDSVRVDHNQALQAGGGVFAAPAALGEVFRMQGDALINYNESPLGGGVYLQDGQMEMTGGALIIVNTAIQGGGIYREDGDLTGADCEDNVVNNHPDDIAPAC